MRRHKVDWVEADVGAGRPMSDAETGHPVGHHRPAPKRSKLFGVKMRHLLTSGVPRMYLPRQTPDLAHTAADDLQGSSALVKLVLRPVLQADPSASSQLLATVWTFPAPLSGMSKTAIRLRWRLANTTFMWCFLCNPRRRSNPSAEPGARPLLAVGLVPGHCARPADVRNTVRDHPVGHHPAQCRGGVQSDRRNGASRLPLLGHLLDGLGVELVDLVDQVVRVERRHVLDLLLEAGEVDLRLPLLLRHGAPALVLGPAAGQPLVLPRVDDLHRLRHRLSSDDALGLGLGEHLPGELHRRLGVGVGEHGRLGHGAEVAREHVLVLGELGFPDGIGVAEQVLHARGVGQVAQREAGQLDAGDAAVPVGHGVDAALVDGITRRAAFADRDPLDVLVGIHAEFLQHRLGADEAGVALVADADPLALEVGDGLGRTVGLDDDAPVHLAQPAVDADEIDILVLQLDLNRPGGETGDTSELPVVTAWMVWPTPDMLMMSFSTFSWA